MSFWGERFVNLAEIDTLRMPRARDDDARAVRAALEALVRDETREGATLYLPPRAGGVPWAVDVGAASLTLPDRFTVLLGPGARLLPWRAGAEPRAGAGVLRIDGSFRAPLDACLPTVALASRWPGGASPPRSIGRVRFMGQRLERVHPAWWGGGRGDVERDTQALEAALQAAWYDRDDGAEARASLAIALDAPLVIRRPVVVRPRPSSRDALLLLGTMPPRDLASIAAAEGFEGPALVVAEGDASLELRGVTLDAADRAPACVAVEAEGLQRPSRASLVGCALYEGSAATVTWGRDGSPAREGSSLSLDGCTLEARGVGLRLRGARDAVVSVRGCALGGAAWALVDVRGCTLALEHCALDNTTLDQELTATPPDPRLVTGGLDLLVRRGVSSLLVDHCASWSDRVLRGMAETPEADDQVIAELSSLRHVPRTARVLGTRVGEEVEEQIHRRPWQPDVIEPRPVVELVAPVTTVIAPTPLVARAVEPLGAKEAFEKEAFAKELLAGTSAATKQGGHEALTTVRSPKGRVAPALFDAFESTLGRRSDAKAETVGVTSKGGAFDPGRARGAANTTRSLPPAIQVERGAWGASRLVLVACVFDRPAGGAHAPAVRVEDDGCVVANLGVHPLVPGEEARVEAVQVRVPVLESVSVTRRAQS